MTITSVSKQEDLVEEIMVVQKEPPKMTLTEQKISQPVTEREHDFILLDFPSKISPDVQPGSCVFMPLRSFFALFYFKLTFLIVLCFSVVTVAEYSQTYVEEAVTFKPMMTIVAEEITVQERPVIPEQKISQTLREIEDDWFSLLYVAPRETLYMPPGINNILSIFHMHAKYAIHIT